MFRLPAAKDRNAANSFYKSSKPAEKKQEYRAEAQIEMLVSLGIIIVNLSGRRE